MALNRFSKITPVDFSNIPLYELDYENLSSMLQNQQNMYDTAQALADTVPEHRQADVGAVKAYSDSLNQQMEQASQTFVDQGIGAGNRQLSNLIRQVRKDFSPGGFAYEAKMNYANESKQREAILNSKLTAPQKEKLLANLGSMSPTTTVDPETGQYNFGDFGYNRFNNFAIPDYVGVTDKLFGYAKQIIAETFGEQGDYEKVVDPDTKMVSYQSTTNKNVVLTQDEIKNVLENAAQGDAQLKAYLDFLGEHNLGKEEEWQGGLQAAMEAFDRDDHMKGITFRNAPITGTKKGSKDDVTAPGVFTSTSTYSVQNRSPEGDFYSKDYVEKHWNTYPKAKRTIKETQDNIQRSTRQVTNEINEGLSQFNFNDYGITSELVVDPENPSAINVKFTDETGTQISYKDLPPEIQTRYINYHTNTIRPASANLKREHNNYIATKRVFNKLYDNVSDETKTIMQREDNARLAEIERVEKLKGDLFRFVQDPGLIISDDSIISTLKEVGYEQKYIDYLMGVLRKGETPEESLMNRNYLFDQVTQLQADLNSLRYDDASYGGTLKKLNGRTVTSKAGHEYFKNIEEALGKDDNYLKAKNTLDNLANVHRVKGLTYMIPPMALKERGLGDAIASIGKYKIAELVNWTGPDQPESGPRPDVRKRDVNDAGEEEIGPEFTGYMAQVAGDIETLKNQIVTTNVNVGMRYDAFDHYWMLDFPRLIFDKDKVFDKKQGKDKQVGVIEVRLDDHEAEQILKMMGMDDEAYLNLHRRVNDQIAQTAGYAKVNTHTGLPVVIDQDVLDPVNKEINVTIGDYDDPNSQIKFKSKSIPHITGLISELNDFTFGMQKANIKADELKPEAVAYLKNRIREYDVAEPQVHLLANYLIQSYANNQNNTVFGNNDIGSMPTDKVFEFLGGGEAGKKKVASDDFNMSPEERVTFEELGLSYTPWNEETKTGVTGPFVSRTIEPNIRKLTSEYTIEPLGGTRTKEYNATLEGSSPSSYHVDIMGARALDIVKNSELIKDRNEDPEAFDAKYGIIEWDDSYDDHIHVAFKPIE